MEGMSNLRQQHEEPGPSPSPKKRGQLWFIYVMKVENVYSVHLGYKNSKGFVSEYSCSKSNIPTKIPFGTPVQCEYIMKKEAEESVGMMQFTSRKREVRDLKLKHLNCFEGGENAFSRRVTSMVIDKKENLLAQFLTLISRSKEFNLHREEIHSDDGEI